MLLQFDPLVLFWSFVGPWLAPLLDIVAQLLKGRALENERRLRIEQHDQEMERMRVQHEQEMERMQVQHAHEMDKLGAVERIEILRLQRARVENRTALAKEKAPLRRPNRDRMRSRKETTH